MVGGTDDACVANAPDHAIDEEAASITRQIGSRIVELRQRKGWAHKDFAEALNSTVQWVSLVETGRQNLTIHTLVRLAIKLSVAPRLLWEFARTTASARSYLAWATQEAA